MKRDPLFLCRHREAFDLKEGGAVTAAWIPAFAGMTNYLDLASVFVTPAKAGVHLNPRNIPGLGS
jgi:hypothetical protein